MTTPIQLFVPKFRVEETLVQIRECLEKGWTGLGFKTVEFEERWREYTGLPHAHFLGSATAGLHLAVRLLKERDRWNEGDEIITTPLTFVSTNHAILYERLCPVFADIDAALCLDPESIQARLTPRTRAVMFVGIGGNAGQLRAIARLCAAHNLRLILDGAHMAGTRVGGRHIGGEADITVFSFQAVKNLPTADSGMICCRDAELDAAARKWTWLGISKDTYTRTQSQGSYKWVYDVEHVGFKYHGNSIMASMGLVALKYLDQDDAYRRQLAQWYDAGFADAPGITTVPIPPDCEPSRHLYQIMVEQRDEVILALNNQEIYPGVHYRDNTHYPMYSFAEGSCPRARRASDTLISLPLHLGLSNADVRRVTTSVREIVEKQKQE